METMTTQSFNEGAIKTDGMVFYTDGSENWLKGDQRVGGVFCCLAFAGDEKRRPIAQGRAQWGEGRGFC